MRIPPFSLLIALLYNLFRSRARPGARTGAHPVQERKIPSDPIEFCRKYRYHREQTKASGIRNPRNFCRRKHYHTDEGGRYVPGRKKKTSRVLILLLFLLSLVFGATLTRSSADLPTLQDQEDTSETADREQFAQQDGSTQADPRPNHTDPASDQEPSPSAPQSSEEETPEPIPEGTWTQENGLWYYQLDSGYKTGWLRENGHWYYFDQTGVMQIGWVQSQERWFYMDEDGIMQTGWIQSGQKWYYLDEEGVMQTGWLDMDGQKYYLNPKGDMQTGWLQDQEEWYYFNANGTMATDWIVDNGKRYFLQEDGTWDPTVSWDSSAPSDTSDSAMVALTYNDGPGMYTSRLLDVLEAYNAKATFFLVGNQISDYPAAVSRMKELGCEIGNHTMDHEDLSRLTEKEITDQIQAADQALFSITGQETTLLRPPYGNTGDILTAAADKPLILWSLDSRDEKTGEITAIVDTVISNVQDGDIVLLHDSYETTAAASEILIPTLQEKGYQLVTVSELASAKGLSLEPGQLYESIP